MNEPQKKSLATLETIVLIAGVAIGTGFVWLVTTVIGWFIGMASGENNGYAYAAVASAIPAIAVVLLWLLTWKARRELRLTIVIVGCILVMLSGACNFAAIDHGKPPRIAG